MKSFVACLLIGVAAAARLPNAYIPPNPQSAGGSQFLQTPNAPRPGANYGAPVFGASSQQSQFASAGQGGRGGAKSADAQATILKYENNPNTGDGSYSYEFETSNGIKVQEQGYNTQQGPENSEQIVSGSYSYIGDDGQTYTVTYKADANGFQPQGDHLPTPPPIPVEIQKSLALIAAAQSNLPQTYQPQGYKTNNQPQGYSTNNQPQGYSTNNQPQRVAPGSGGSRQQSFDPQTGYKY